MIKRTCKQCGKEFILNDSEIKFYKSRNLNLPKRCKECRQANKQSKEESVNTSAGSQTPAVNNGKAKRIKLAVAVAVILILILGGIFGIQWDKFFDPADNPLYYSSSDLPTDSAQNEELEVPAPTYTAYNFRNDKLWSDHFDKHGAEVGASSKEDYLAKANAVINNPDTLSKLETDDGDNDTVFFLEATGEFVVLSGDGYIRTYYIADLDYFNCQ